MEKSGALAGVDGIKWKSKPECMKAAINLGRSGYKASPLRLIKIVDKKGKERSIGVPTYFDKAMCLLHSFVLAPVMEARSERSSFAFRFGRSTFDVHECILEYLDEGRYQVLHKIRSGICKGCL